MKKLLIGLLALSSISSYANTFELPVIKVRNALLSYADYTILGVPENAVNYCKIRGFNSAESFESKITIWRGTPGMYSMVWNLASDASLSYESLDKAETFIKFQKINKNGYGGNLEMRKVNCTMAEIAVDQVKELRASGVDAP